jgi:hypothetical protein
MRRDRAKYREALYERCRGNLPFPICNLCNLEIATGQDWEESHQPVPRALGGKKTGIAHVRCNRDHGAKVVTPAVAKGKRVRRRHLGIVREGLGRSRMPGGRHSKVKITMDRRIVPRLSLRDKLILAGIIMLEDCTEEEVEAHFGNL